MELTYPYQRSVRTMRQVVEFDTIDPEPIVDIAPNLVIRNFFTTPPVTEVEIQNSVTVSEHSTSTERIALQSTGMNHVEGGWPRDVDPAEPEQMARYKRKCEKEDRYHPAARHLFALLRPSLRQNNAVDIYQDPLSDLTPESNVSTGAMCGAVSAAGPVANSTGESKPGDTTGAPPPKTDGSPTAGGDSGSAPVSTKPAETKPTVMVEVGSSNTGSEKTPPLVLRTTFVDPLVSVDRPDQLSRVVTSINWHTADSMRGKVCVSFSPNNGFSYNGSQLTASLEPISSYVFDLHTPHQPETTLTGPSALSVLKWSPRDMHLIAGGCTDGTVCIFDTRRAPRPTAKTAPGSSSAGSASGALGPQGRVTGLLWLQVASKATEVMSVHQGTNACFVWDIRNFVEPIDTIRLATRQPGSHTSSSPGSVYTNHHHAAICADYAASTVGPGKILVGSSSGCVFSVNRRGRSEADRIQSTFSSHHGAVHAVQRNPFIVKNFATAGDWCVRLWNEDLKHPVLSLPWSRSPVVDVTWHPNRPGVLAAATVDGEVQIWNLLTSTTEPRATYLIPHTRVHCIAFTFEGTILSVGCTNGTVSVLSVSDEVLMTASPQADKVALTQQFERVLVREKMNAAEYKDQLMGRHAELYQKEVRSGAAQHRGAISGPSSMPQSVLSRSGLDREMFGASTNSALAESHFSPGVSFAGAACSWMPNSSMMPAEDGGANFGSPRSATAIIHAASAGQSPGGNNNASQANVMTVNQFPGLSVAPADIDFFNDASLDEQLGAVSEGFAARLKAGPEKSKRSTVNTTAAKRKQSRKSQGEGVFSGEDESDAEDDEGGQATAAKLLNEPSFVFEVTSPSASGLMDAYSGRALFGANTSSSDDEGIAPEAPFSEEADITGARSGATTADSPGSEVGLGSTATASSRGAVTAGGSATPTGGDSLAPRRPGPTSQMIDELVSPQSYEAAGTQLSHQPLFGPTPPMGTKAGGGAGGSAVLRTPPAKQRARRDPNAQQ